nr:hypothetical protein [Tanacetum cinerariifolium]
EGTSSKLGVLNVPSDDSEEDISWNSLNDEKTNTQEQDRHDDKGNEKDESDDGEEGDDDDKDGDESFDLIPRTPEDSEDDGNGEEDRGLRISEEERIHKEDEADELYCDVDINQGRGLQASQDIEDSHVTLTPVHPDGRQESSSVHQNTQQFVALLPIELTNEDIRNSNTYKEYYAVATGATPPKPKASVWKTRSSSDTIVTPPTAAAGPRLDEESFDPISKTPKDTDDEGNGEENLGINISREEGHDKEEEEDELYRDVNINQGRVAPLLMFSPTITPSTIATITTTQQAPTPPTTASSSLLQDLPNFGSLFGFDHRLKTLKANFFELMQTNQFARAVSSIPGIVQRYMDQQMNKVVKVAVQIQSDRLRDKAQAKNDKFLKIIDENMEKIIKEQVKEQVKVQVSKILPKIEQTVNEQLEAEVLTRSSNSSKTSYVVAADLSEMELKKILIEKMEGNKSIHRSNEHRNLYKALVKAYESDKIILDTYKDTTGGPRDVEKERSQSQQALHMRKLPGALASQHKGLNLDRRWQASLISELAKRTDSRFFFNELMDTPMDFSNFLLNRLKVDTLTPELLAGPTYELMKGSCKSLVELKFLLEEVYKATTDQLDWVNPEGDSSCKYTTYVTKTKAADYGYIKWIKDLVPRTMWIQFYGFAVNRESARDVYSKRRIIAVTQLKIFEWHNYKHLDWITVRRDDDKLYKFKEVEERFAFNVSLRMFTRSIIIQRRMEDLQLDVESYQKKLNLTKPDTNRSDLKCKEAYIAYSNPRGFIYQNKDKQNKLMRIDELHKFSDGMLIDVRTALDDRLKGIRMKYLPQLIWRKSDKDREVAMIQAIDKRLKTRRIMRRLERFFGGRLYEGDFRMLQRTI